MGKVHIVGGSSSDGKISIFSNEFTATARCRNGSITCSVRRRSPLTSFLLEKKYLPIPRILRMLLLAIAGMATWKGRLFLCLYLLAVTVWAMHSPVSVSISLERSWMFFCLITVQILFYTKSFVARWHGTEHMAIAAYNRSGSTEIKDIRQEVPFHEMCGGRFMFPFLAGALVAGFVAKKLGVNDTLVFLAMIEVVLWVDTLVGLERIPLASHVSRLLQEKITTEEPGYSELRTAQRALVELVAAHDS